MNARPVSWLQPTVCTADRSAASQPATTCSLIRCTRLRLISGSTGCCSCAGVSSKRRRHLMEKKIPQQPAYRHQTASTNTYVHRHIKRDQVGRWGTAIFSRQEASRQSKCVPERAIDRDDIGGIDGIGCQVVSSALDPVPQWSSFRILLLVG